MTEQLRDALRSVAKAQVHFAQQIASTHGADSAAELNDSWQSLLAALDPEPVKAPSDTFQIFPKRTRKKSA